jgi:hypothetical protein
VAGRIRSIEKSNDLIGNRTRDFPACSILPRPTTLPHAVYPDGGTAGNVSVEPEENHVESQSQYSLCPRQDSNQTPPYYTSVERYG